MIVYTILIHLISGAYCPEGTRSPYEFECPAGTYNNRTTADDAFDCLPCPGRWRHHSITYYITIKDAETFKDLNSKTTQSLKLAYYSSGNWSEDTIIHII